jgi:cation diffusion facilitator family transporter
MVPAAMLIAALAYLYARRNARNPRFTFGTGKLGDLAGFASAIALALIALLIGWESLLRLANPVAISFPQAIAVAVIGLFVNLACAWLLREDHAHQHGHRHHHHGHDHHDEHARHSDHGHEAASRGRDNNLRAAYLHVLADALTSVLAIVALTVGSLNGWIGIVGALVIARWSIGLIRDTGGVLLDYTPAGEDLPEEIRAAIETNGDRITDLHVWQLGPGHHGAIVSLVTKYPQRPSLYRRKLAHIPELSHVTIEVEPFAAPKALRGTASCRSDTRLSHLKSFCPRAAMRLQATWSGDPIRAGCPAARCRSAVRCSLPP